MASVDQASQALYGVDFTILIIILAVLVLSVLAIGLLGMRNGIDIR